MLFVFFTFSFFNNVMGIRDPEQLLPPRFCKDAQLEDDDGEDPATFFSVFENTELDSDRFRNVVHRDGGF